MFPSKWALALFAACAILAVVAMCVLSSKLYLKSPQQFAAADNKNGSFGTASQTRQQKSTAARNAKFYWKFSMFEGIPFIKVRLASQPNHPFTCVLDSGSANLNVASPECDYCNPSHGVYVSNVKNAWHRTTLAYGTQEDTAVLKKDQIYLTNKKPNKKPKKKKDGSDAADAANSSSPQLADVDVYVTVDRAENSSNFNVFGVSNTGFLKNLLGPSRALLISFQWHNVGGFVTSISKQEAAMYRECALARAPLQRVLSLPFYMVKLKALKIGGVRIPAPKYCILDTGSNVISVPPASFDALLPRIGVGSNFEVVFGEPGPEAEARDIEPPATSGAGTPFGGVNGGGAGGKIVVSHANYTYFSQLMIDDEVPDFGVGSMMVLGCNGMMGYTFVFESGSVSVVRSNRNVCEGIHKV